jgi:putative transposase
MNRAASGADIFSTSADCDLLLEALSEASSRYAVEVHAYCLMSNHFHLLARSKAGKLSDFMRFAVGRFSRMHNLRRGSDGPLFRGRFTSKEIDSDSHLVECLRYIHLNPVRAGLVTTAEQWDFSSARAYLLADVRPSWLITRDLLAMFGPTSQRERYNEFLCDGLELQNGVRPGGSDTN